VNRGVLMTMQSTFEDTVGPSIWNTRGWTFQEMVLSRRLLVLGNEQCFFRCNKETWYEDMHRETHGAGKIVNLTKGQQMSGSSVPVVPSDREDGRVTYSKLVKPYVIRKFTNEGDRLSGFVGILNQYFDGEHKWGLPRAFFHQALTWDWHLRSAKRIPLFPSWSWAGWTPNAESTVLVTEADFHPFDGHPFSGQPVEVPVFYEIDPQSHTSHVDAEMRVRKVQEYVPSPWRSLTSSGQEQSSLKQLGEPYWRLPNAQTEVDEEMIANFPCSSRLLFFWTSSGKLYLRHHVQHNNRNLYEVTAQRGGKKIGTVTLEHIWPLAECDSCSFIVLGWYTMWKRAGPIVVMTEMTDGISYRIGKVDYGDLNGFHIESWMAAELEWTLIAMG
jgi:hypothetical protein